MNVCTHIYIHTFATPVNPSLAVVASPPYLAVVVALPPEEGGVVAYQGGVVVGGDHQLVEGGVWVFSSQ